MAQARGAAKRDVRGILLLDKPQGLTSNQALQRVKRLFGAVKAGHTGSLDPLATGMLPICFGAATRISGYLLDAGKRYAVVAELGAATDSGDADGVIIERSTAPAPDLDQVIEVLRSFEGEIEQVPPMYSALKRDGKPLYELARRGIVVDRAARSVRIYSIALESYAWPQCGFIVQCSKGTYVRTLVEDVARSLGTLGHVIVLRRLAVEPFQDERMYTLDELEALAGEGTDVLDALLLPLERALAGWPRIDVQAEQAQRLMQGQSLAADAGWPGGEVCLYAEAIGFFGIGEVTTEGQLAPRRVFLR
jgi:tRNA pseudouridine55 synthase